MCPRSLTGGNTKETRAAQAGKGLVRSPFKLQSKPGPAQSEIQGLGRAGRGRWTTLEQHWQMEGIPQTMGAGWHGALAVARKGAPGWDSGGVGATSSRTCQHTCALGAGTVSEPMPP